MDFFSQFYFLHGASFFACANFNEKTAYSLPKLLALSIVANSAVADAFLKTL